MKFKSCCMTFKLIFRTTRDSNTLSRYKETDETDIIMDLMFTDCHKMIFDKKEFEKLSNFDRIKILKAVASKVCHLHSLSLDHRDLKSFNILVTYSL